MERCLTPREIQSCLQGMRWPASRQELKDQLFSQGMGIAMIGVLTDISAADIQNEEEARQVLERIFNQP
ncbi:hypothetical protein DPQ33_07845 [Oceanidesulfovibrio indonesiensis]|uniref:Uncharacterized protein n=1 Tax=Oceanidesulfovibrio indonesiensis TaxID=54767 RepID=A0A7M3MGI5_9BACT|nr:DUF2795 domain-containing protein [Oceanidesulfovibrio indonesiensis]TVM18009.1 hypothetical protein DPQ33_07845 [Oceanidesulfovibrio indonesiensis]